MITSRQKSKQNKHMRAQVTVAMLYSEAALVLLGNVTPAQMVTTIVDAIASSNLALKNSQVPMVFQLAYVGKVRALRAQILLDLSQIVSPEFRVLNCSLCVPPVPLR